MTNLLQETLATIQAHGLTSNDVLWVGSSDGNYALDWNRFAQVANIEYDAGYGGQEIASDLVVVFNNGAWLERTEYDGSEDWSYQSRPLMNPIAKPFRTVKSGNLWASVGEMNRPGGKYGSEDLEDAS